MYDFLVYICGHGETKDLTTVSLCRLYKSGFHFDEPRYVGPEAMIARSRSRACTQFLKDETAPYMIFVDSDIVFTSEDIGKLYSALQKGYDIVAGGYPMRGGQAFPIRSWNKPITFNNEVNEVEYVSAGFMGISRRALEQIRDKLDLPLLHEGSVMECYPFFENGRYLPEMFYLSEDWDFVVKARQAGFKAYFHTGVLVNHIKEIMFAGVDTARQMLQKQDRPMERPLAQSTLLGDAADILDISEALLVEKLSQDCAGHVADEWNQWQGNTEDFYKQSKAQLMDLIKFNLSDAYWSDRMNPLKDETDKNVLDIGCGIGTAALYLASNRNKIVGYELNDNLLEFAKARQEKFGLSNIFFTDSLPPRHRFDLVVAIDVLEHIEDLHGFLLDLSDGMKPGAKLYHADAFEKNEAYPMHFDHSEHIDEWLEEAGLVIFDKRWAIRK